MEENWANLEGETIHPHHEGEKESFKRDEKIAQRGDLDNVTQQAGKAIAKEKAMETLPLLNPNILMGSWLT